MSTYDDIKAEIKIGLVSAPLTTCPKCDSDDVDRYHHAADAMPECFFYRCGECDHEWGHA